LKKLFNLKKWLTLQDAARHLSIVVGEEVSVADVLRLALDGHLKLSVNFVNHTQARRGKVIPIEEAEDDDLLSEFFSNLPDSKEIPGEPIKFLKGINLDDQRVLNLDKEVVELDGVYDLAMLGNESHDVEHKYQMLTNGPSVALMGLDGAFVIEDADTMYQLLERRDENEYQIGSNGHLREIERAIALKKIEPEIAQKLLAKHKEDRKTFLAREKENRDAGRDSENYYPAGGLPNDSVMVVRTGALREFEQAINVEPAPNDKPMTTNERNTLLTIIAALCDYSAVDPAARGSASHIASMTEELGAPVTDETIRKVLVQIPNAVERRMK
jgi:hypothetical protein